MATLGSFSKNFWEGLGFIEKFTLFCTEGNSDGRRKIMTKPSPRNHHDLVNAQSFDFMALS